MIENVAAYEESNKPHLLPRYSDVHTSTAIDGIFDNFIAHLKLHPAAERLRDHKKEQQTAINQQKNFGSPLFSVGK
jgi:predicted SprT family Zn-dependent metalloprotease